MSGFMGFLNRQAYAMMRIMVGFLFLWHGAQKLFNFPVPMPPGSPAFVVYIGGSIEFFGGILVMVGLFTRPAAFLCSGMMAVAYWMVHGTQALLPIQNHGDLAALFCFVFLFVSTQGGGLWSIDGVRGKK